MEVAPSFGMYFAVLGDFMCYSPVPEGKSCVAIVGLRISAKLLSAKLCLDGKPPSYIGLWQHDKCHSCPSVFQSPFLYVSETLSTINLLTVYHNK